jgi:predicted nuclease of predicted toxin-antitoxin system
MWRPLEDVPKKLFDEVAARIAGRAKFLVDESLGEAVARVISDVGYNVRFGPDVGLAGRSDEEVFAYAWKKGRVLLTHDRDFLDDRRFPFHRNPGVIVLPGGHGTHHNLIGALREVLHLFGNYCNLFPNAKIEVSNENAWSVRHFVKKDGAIYKLRLNFGDRENVKVWDD